MNWFLITTDCCSSERTSDRLPKRLYLQGKGKEEGRERRKREKEKKKKRKVKRAFFLKKGRNYTILQKQLVF